MKYIHFKNIIIDDTTIFIRTCIYVTQIFIYMYVQHVKNSWKISEKYVCQLCNKLCCENTWLLTPCVFIFLKECCISKYVYFYIHTTRQKGRDIVIFCFASTSIRFFSVVRTNSILLQLTDICASVRCSSFLSHIYIYFYVQVSILNKK